VLSKEQFQQIRDTRISPALSIRAQGILDYFCNNAVSTRFAHHVRLDTPGTGSAAGRAILRGVVPRYESAREIRQSAPEKTF